MDNIKYTITFGHVRLFSYFKPDGDKLIGMGCKWTYDEDGVLVSYEEEPTGLEMWSGYA